MEATGAEGRQGQEWLMPTFYEKMPGAQKVHKPLATLRARSVKANTVWLSDQVLSKVKSWSSWMFTAHIPRGLVPIENFMP